MIFKSNITKQDLILLFQIAAFSVFLGRAWQHLVWDAPFRTLLWDEDIMKGLIEGFFNTPWETYITSEKTDENIQKAVKATGWFYLFCAVMVFFIKKWKKLSGVFMILGSISLIVLAALYCKERFFSIGQFLEYALQFSSPLLLYFVVKKGEISPRIRFTMKLCIALTFICHGLYAVGYYPRPGHFSQMTINILGVQEQTAIQFLNLAGYLDFLIGVGIFFPFKISRWILLYAILWGFLTTIARVWAYVELEFFLESLKQWAHQSIYRIPHFLIPFILYQSTLMKNRVAKEPVSPPS